MNRLQFPSALSGPPRAAAWPQLGSAGFCGVGVPYQATLTRPASPADAQANMLLRSPGVGIWTGAVHVVPSSVEEDQYRRVSPVISPSASTGACSHTAMRLPALSMAMVGKFPPVRNPGKLATGRSTHDNPVGSEVNGTFWHRPIRMALKAALSWITKILPVVGLTSTLPMIPSLQGALISFSGAKMMPAVSPA